MEKEFNLSEKMIISYPNYYCEEDVKEFIRLLKEEINKGYFKFEKTTDEIIDKLAGRSFAGNKLKGDK